MAAKIPVHELNKIHSKRARAASLDVREEDSDVRRNSNWSARKSLNREQPMKIANTSSQVRGTRMISIEGSSLQQNKEEK